MLTIERATPADAALISSLERAPEARQFVTCDDEAVHRERMADPGTVYLRILDDGAMAGFFILRLDPDGRSIEFRRVVVAPARRGIGQAAIAAMEDFCRREIGRPRIWLDVFEENDRARHVYAKLGYRHFGRSVYSDGRPLLLLDKDL